MKYAQIKNGVVVNTIVLDDESLIEMFSEGFDELVILDEEIELSVGVGVVYEDEEFVVPNNEPVESEEGMGPVID